MTERSRAESGRDRGFSLVELLVVIAILGILAAIAIPLLLGQRERAVDATVKSDLRLVAGAVEAIRTDGAPVSQTALREGLRLAPGTVVTVYEREGAYCLLGTRVSGGTGTQDWTYRSTAGLGETGDVTCSGPPSFDLP